MLFMIDENYLVMRSDIGEDSIDETLLGYGGLVCN